MKENAREIFFAILLLTTSLALGEGLLRLIGLRPHTLKVPAIISQPAQALIPHPDLGLSLNPGNYQVQINQHLQYQCTHLLDSTRSTGSTMTGEKKVFLLGCSFTYGMGVSDSLTFPYLLQKEFPNWQILNYGVPAYGSLQSLLQLQKQLESGRQPNLVVLNYASLHDSRNKLSPAQQKYWREALNGVRQLPYIAQVPRGEALDIQYLSVDEMKKRWKWSAHFALLHLLEQVSDHILDGFEDKHLISQKIILKISNLCRANHIPFFVTGISNDAVTEQMLTFCGEHQIPTLYFGVDMADKKYNLSPYDSHPNALAHQIYAEKLGDFLKGRSW